jgi:hypothetical protein
VPLTRIKKEQRGTAVTHYHFYFLDAKRKVTDTADVTCDTDEQALAAAREQAYGGKIEIWRGRRRVGVYAPGKPSTLDDAD